MQKPGTVQAIAIMQLVGGILGVLMAIGLALGTFFLYIPWIYSLVMGILCIVKGAQMLSDKSIPTPPKATAIMQIVNVICCDWINLTLGIITLVLLGNDEVKAYFEPVD